MNNLNSKNMYYGITIGPVFDTIMTATSPAALWYASYFFSNVTLELCKEIIRYGIKKEEIITPAFQGDCSNDGIGRYHDRIIFKASIDFNAQKLDEIIDNVRDKMSKMMMSDLEAEEEDKVRIKTFFKEYLQIYYVVVPEEKVEKNAIFNISPYLNSLELFQGFVPDGTYNCFLQLFRGKNNSDNLLIKESVFINQLTSSQLLTIKGTIKTLDEIAYRGFAIKEQKKKYKYFAVVQADGDEMGQVIKNLNNDDLVHKFSSRCLEYTQESARLIGDFGGVTIFGGGDDLLFLAPVENEFGKTIFDLCDIISKCFAKFFSNYNNGNLSVSFGISINYVKYPLYECLQDAADLLFKIAKKQPGKNSTAVKIRKGSGKVIDFILLNQSQVYKNFSGLIQSFLEEDKGESFAEQLAHSVTYKAQLFQNLFCQALKNNSGQEIKNLLFNLMESPSGKNIESYVENLEQLLLSIKDHEDEKINKYTKEEDQQSIKDDKYFSKIGNTWVSFIEAAKFFVEEGGETW